MFIKEKTATFDVDPQNTFTELCPEELPITGGQLIGRNLNRQAEYGSIRILSRDAHNEKALWIANNDNPQFKAIKNHKNLDMFWNRHAIVGTFGFELIPELNIEDYDYQVLKGIEIDKHPYGACYHDLKDKETTGVIEYLKTKGITTVIVGGLALDYCVRKTCIQLFKAGFKVYLNLLATKAVSIDGALNTIRELETLGIKMVNLGESND